MIITIIYLCLWVDIELLEACRAEFHRRLRMYHDWKQKNTSQTQEPDFRAPQIILDTGKYIIIN